MARNRVRLVLATMLLVAIAVRLNNVLTFPSLRSFDGYGHFVYIWFMATEWRVPLATSGWSFFHPPLYYALMASIWTLFPIDPLARLTLGTGLISMLSLVHGFAAYVITRRYVPGRPIIHVLAAGLMFFLPLHLYTAAFLGNESLNSILCTTSIVTLLWVLRDPSWRRGAVLGLCLGAALLTKFTAIAVVAGSFGALTLHTLLYRRWRAGLGALVTAATVMLIVCGWFYARNLVHYGTPFKLSRDEFMVRHVENYQSQGRRTVWEYVLFDPVILFRPQWPRGLQLTGDFPADRPYSALREAVPTGLYANAWFDGGTGMFLPPVTVNDESRRAGQILLTLAVVPTVLVLVGIWTAIRRLLRDGWDDTLGGLLLIFGTMVALFVQATSTVPMHAAVKATYMTPVTVIFAFWFALGADRVRQASARAFRGVVAICALLALASVLVFTNDLVVARGWLTKASVNIGPWQNLYGIVYYAGGWRDRARELFTLSAADGWSLGEENLGYLDFQDGRLMEALYHVRTAAALQPRHSFGTREDRARFDRANQADYQNQMATIYYEMGALDLALLSAEKSYALDHSAPEIEYDFAVLKLARALATPNLAPEHLRQVVAQSRSLLSSAAAKDFNFFEVRALLGVLDALEDDCERGLPAMREALAPHPDQHRIYPLGTGTGNVHVAALRRRTFIADLPEPLRAEYQIARCLTQVTRGEGAAQ